MSCCVDDASACSIRGYGYRGTAAAKAVYCGSAIRLMTRWELTVDVKCVLARLCAAQR